MDYKFKVGDEVIAVSSPVLTKGPIYVVEDIYYDIGKQYVALEGADGFFMPASDFVLASEKGILYHGT